MTIICFKVSKAGVLMIARFVMNRFTKLAPTHSPTCLRLNPNTYLSGDRELQIGLNKTCAERFTNHILLKILTYSVLIQIFPSTSQALLLGLISES